MHQGALSNDANIVELRNCASSGNTAPSGDVVTSNTAATTRFFGNCSFLGDYDNDECIFNAEDDTSSFEFYYTAQAIERGVVCSAAPVLIYNTEVNLPISDDVATVTCQTEGIVDYCAFDCSSGTAEDNGGITCR